MTLKISDPAYNLRELASYNSWFSSDTKILTEDSQEMFEQIQKNQTSLFYTVKKVTLAALATLAVSALTIGPFVAGLAYVATQPQAAATFIQKVVTGRFSTHAASAATGAILAYSSTSDGRDMLRFLAKGSIYAFANLGVKAGQTVWGSYDDAAKEQKENNAKDLESAVKDLTSTYADLATSLHNLPKEEGVKIAKAIKSNLSAIENRYRKMGIEERSINQILRPLKGELELLNG